MQPDTQNDAPTHAPNPDELGRIGTQVDDALSPELLASLEEDWGRPRAAAAPRHAALLVAALLAPMVYSEWPTHLLPGSWLGFVALPEGLLPAPLPPYWHGAAQALAALLDVHVLFAAQGLAVLGVVLTACGTAAIATLLFAMARRRIPPRQTNDDPPDAMPVHNRMYIFFAKYREAILQRVPGTIAGIACYLSYPAQLAWFSGGPEAVTAAMAVWGCYFYLRHYDHPGLPLGMILAAFLIGAACVQQPYFLVLAFLCLLYTMTFAESDTSLWRRLGAHALVFTFALAMPALHLMRNGLAPRALLDHLLHLPYPDFSCAPGAFETTYFRERANLSGDALLGLIIDIVFMLVITIALLRRRLIRDDAVFVVIGAALLGPAMKLIANPPRETLVPIDVESPAFVGLCLLLAAVVPAAVTLFARIRLPYLRYPLIATLLFFIVGATGFERKVRLGATPDNNPHSFYAQLFDLSLASPPPSPPKVPNEPGPLVIAGRLDLASTLWLAQYGLSLERHQRIVPSSWLAEPAGRAAAQRILGTSTSLRADFPDADALTRWKHALPFHAESLNVATEAAFVDELEPFALWDLVADEALKSTIYFLGVDVPWLYNRATVQGQRLAFPGQSLSEPNNILRGDLPIATKSGPLTTITRSFLSGLSRTKHKALQNRGALNLMQRYPGVEESWITKPTPEMNTLDAAYVRLMSNAKLSGGKITKTLEADLDLLWRNERFFLLREIYRSLTSQSNNELEVYYQLAAVSAELGDWDQTREALARWEALLGAASEEAALRFHADSRFDLYRRWTALQ